VASDLRTFGGGKIRKKNPPRGGGEPNANNARGSRDALPGRELFWEKTYKEKPSISKPEKKSPFTKNIRGRKGSKQRKEVPRRTQRRGRTSRKKSYQHSKTTGRRGGGRGRTARKKPGCPGL